MKERCCTLRIKSLVKQSIALGSYVVTDGPTYLWRIVDAGGVLIAVIVSSAPPSPFAGAIPMLGKIKSTIVGTYRVRSQEARSAKLRRVQIAH